MPGLDKVILDSIKPEITFRRIRTDLRTDFIFAPHLNLIFRKTTDELWEHVYEQLRAGKYEPSLPLTISVPKPKGFSRPGSILQPADRVVYQIMADLVAPDVEAQLDRSRTFSHVLNSDEDAEGMFINEHDCWRQLQSHLKDISALGGFFVKADIANYFERIPQHHLVNLLTASGCRSEVVRLLEELLLAFQERDSFGIIQGLFPSDLLGNFYLSDFDAECEIRKRDSARYVDNIYVRFATKHDARRGLLDLMQQLRKDGLHLNEAKSGIKSSDELIWEETELDRLFAAAWEEIKEEIKEETLEARFGYGFAADWDTEDDEEDDEDDLDENEITLAAVVRLYESLDEHLNQTDKIEKFCLPFLRAAQNDIAIERAVTGILVRPHMSRTYLAYLTQFAAHDAALCRRLQAMLTEPTLFSDYQCMFLLALLCDGAEIQRGTVNEAINILRDPSMGVGPRALAAILAAKRGTPNQKRSVRLAYEDEGSPYVRSAILYASRYFSKVEQRTCIKAWGGHSFVNSLVAKSIRAIT